MLSALTGTRLLSASERAWRAPGLQKVGLRDRRARQQAEHGTQVPLQRSADVKWRLKVDLHELNRREATTTWKRKKKEKHRLEEDP